MVASAQVASAVEASANTPLYLYMWPDLFTVYSVDHPSYLITVYVTGLSNLSVSK